MSAAKALAYALCDKLESKKVDEVVRNLVSSGWNRGLTLSGTKTHVKGFWS
ncbi:hypothetical protein XM84_004725 [Salmonella enterica subsp. enterica]|nr:hypothetical protein [Salmonella enterica subsp. enterica]EDW2587962.1 hypothetical protein [Salmonella enterica subsp. enterica]